LAQIEALDADAEEYIMIDRASLERAWSGRSQSHETPADEQDDTIERDTLLPPLHQLIIDATSPTADQGEGVTVVPSFEPDRITVVANLDRANPLTEARWVKTGEIEQWILSLALANGSDVRKEEQLSAWRGKIEVVDPEPVGLGYLQAYPNTIDRLTCPGDVGGLVAGTNDPACS
jgi:hypothetical protein